ncbi:MAG: hypothetical protein Athens041674_498 [Parcubacteria group bacterium Athens0416_74]|nr:MAG: hypothetical protein Athens041674_498 [Parcubacteria group bacterium Athens0416_74]
MHTGGMWRRFAYIRYAVILALAGIAVAICIPVSMRFAMGSYLFQSSSDVPYTEVAVVLGASVYRGKPSPVLERRAAKAVELYRAGKVGKILVTGDNGALTYDEVTPVRKYLLEAGIPAGDIFLDHAGFDTYSSMYRARDVFLAGSITVVTQDFHLPRSVYIARHLGIEAYGITAGGDGSEKDYVREIPASGKAVLDLALRRVPKYLGETIPLSGDGSTTWY